MSSDISSPSSAELARVDTATYRERLRDIEYNSTHSKQQLCAAAVTLRKCTGLYRDALRRMKASADCLTDLGIEYNSTYSNMGSVVNRAWTKHDMYERLVSIVIQTAEQKYEIGRALTEFEFYKCQVAEVKEKTLRLQAEQKVLKYQTEDLTRGKVSLSVDCVCDAETPDETPDGHVLALARKHQTMSCNTIGKDITEWFQMQQKLADGTQITVPEDALCAHGRPGPRRPSARNLSTPQLPSHDLLPPPPHPSPLVLTTAAQRVAYRGAAVIWRESDEFQAVLNGQYSQIRINSFPKPEIGNIIKHKCPPDPFWPFVGCCRCDVRELLFWQSDFPKCLPIFRRAFNPLRFAVECAEGTRDELARFAKAIHITVEKMGTEIAELVDEQTLTILN